MAHSTNSPTQQKKTSGFLAIVGKEFHRFFTDKRMVITTVLLPGVMIFALYTLMGSAMQNVFTTDEDYQPVQYALYLPESVGGYMEQNGVSFEEVGPDQVDEIKQRITDQEADMLVIFPEDFDQQVESAFDTSTEYSAPEVSVFYNSAKTESSSGFTTFTALLDSYKNAYFNLFTINAGAETYNLASERDATGFMLAALLPFLMMVFLFSGCLGIAPESIAGEKERGTIATLLVTPLKRWELALGKIVSISCIALLSGLSSFVGTILSLPSILGGGEENVSLAIYSVQEYALLLAVILSTVLLFVGLISIISAYAKSIKEANSAVMPLMILVMVVGISAMFSTSAQSDALFYLIPAYNSVQSMVGILTFSYEPIQVIIAIATNVVVTGICVFVLTKMFNSEKVIFAR